MRCLHVILIACITLCVIGQSAAEEWIGPQAGWYNLKTDFGAIGNGIADDTVQVQAAVDALGASAARSVLFVPAGTYRLTNTVTLLKKNNVAIIGSDPATTTFSWDGPTNSGATYTDNVGAMFVGQGSTLVRIGRLTFDGSSKATWAIRLRWGGYSSSEFFPSGNEFHDLTIKDAGVGIAAGWNNSPSGQDTAEYSHVVRCRFLRCAYAGMVTQDFNSLLWGVIDSYFEDNGACVRSDTGVCNVYDSVFKRSTVADVVVGTTPFISIRGCYSIGSRQFFIANGNTGVCTLQNNTVLDTTLVPLDTGSCHLINLFGNTIRSSHVAVITGSYCGLFAVGNRVAAAGWFVNDPSTDATRSLDNILGSSISAPSEPTLPATPGIFSGPLLIPTARTGAAVQAAIDSAVALYPGQRAVVYLAGGAHYDTTATITIPAGSDVQVVGDTPGASALDWIDQTTTGPVLRLEGPCRARLQDFGIRGGYGSPRAVGLDLTNADQAGGAVIFNQVSVNSNIDHLAVSSQGIDRTNLEFILPHYMGGVDGCFRVSGGLLADSLSGTPPNVRMVDQFATSGTGGNTFQVDDGARLIAYDQWAETGNRRYVRLAGKANFTVNGGSFGFSGTPALSDPVISADGMTGRLNVVGLLLGGCAVRFSGDHPQQQALLATSALGGWGLSADGSVYGNVATAGTNKCLFTISNSLWFDSNPPNDTDISDAWLRTQIRDLMLDRSARLSIPPMGSTAVMATRVDVALVDIGIRISAPVVAVAPTITTQPMDQSVVAGQTATFHVIATGAPSPSYQWRKNGTILTSAVTADYTTPDTTANDAGAVFSVVVTNSAGSVESAHATLTVTSSAPGSTTTGSASAGSGGSSDDDHAGGCGLGSTVSLVLIGLAWCWSARISFRSSQSLRSSQSFRNSKSLRRRQ